MVNATPMSTMNVALIHGVSASNKHFHRMTILWFGDLSGAVRR